MAVITSGLNWEGKPCEFYLENDLLKNLERVKQVVLHKDFDFVALVCGLPGVGKSNFAMSMAKFLDPDFNENKICFSAKDWKEKTLNCPRNSAIILDESFADFNSRRGGSEDFMDILNHLQIIRQRNHFLIFVLPSYFDLHKSLAVYRSSFLFECYGKTFGDRGSFKAFDRYSKKMLYLRGRKDLNDLAQQPNFIGRFTKQKAIPKDLYDELKEQHLKQNAQDRRDNFNSKIKNERDRLIAYMKIILNMKAKIIETIAKTSNKTIYNAINSTKEEIKDEFGDIQDNQKEVKKR